MKDKPKINPFKIIHVNSYKKFIKYLQEDNPEYYVNLIKYFESKPKSWIANLDGKQMVCYARIFNKDIEQYMDKDVFLYSCILHKNLFDLDFYKKFKNSEQIFENCMIFTIGVTKEDLLRLHPFVDNRSKSIVFSCKNSSVYNAIENWFLREIKKYKRYGYGEREDV